MDRLDHAVARARRSHKPQAVFSLGLDQFATINETYGRPVGDELLIAVATRLTGVVRPGDTVARRSDDEFVIVCEDVANPTDADLVAARLTAGLTNPFLLSCAEVEMTASIGLAFADRRTTSATKIIDDAHRAMRRAKAAASASP